MNNSTTLLNGWCFYFTQLLRSAANRHVQTVLINDASVIDTYISSGYLTNNTANTDAVSFVASHWTRRKLRWTVNIVMAKLIWRFLRGLYGQYRKDPAPIAFYFFFFLFFHYVYIFLFNSSSPSCSFLSFHLVVCFLLASFSASLV